MKARRWENIHEEEILGKAYDARLMRRLLTYLRPYWFVTLVAWSILWGAQLRPASKAAVDRYLDPRPDKGPGVFSAPTRPLAFCRLPLCSSCPPRF
jgi:hypothetical protein